jgi:hypothetical protein
MEECFGTQGANGSDCDTPKGFFFARYALATGATVDVYDLHADAGQDEGSRAARRDNVAQVIAAVNANSPEGQAVIIAGDTNSLYTKTPNDLIETVLSGVPGIKDVWVELVNGGVVPRPAPTSTPAAIPSRRARIASSSTRFSIEAGTT